MSQASYDAFKAHVEAAAGGPFPAGVPHLAKPGTPPVLPLYADLNPGEQAAWQTAVDEYTAFAADPETDPLELAYPRDGYNFYTFLCAEVVGFGGHLAKSLNMKRAADMPFTQIPRFYMRDGFSLAAAAA